METGDFKVLAHARHVDRGREVRRHNVSHATIALDMWSRHVSMDWLSQPESYIMEWRASRLGAWFRWLPENETYQIVRFSE